MSDPAWDAAEAMRTENPGERPSAAVRPSCIAKRPSAAPTGLPLGTGRPSVDASLLGPLVGIGRPSVDASPLWMGSCLKIEAPASLGDGPPAPPNETASGCALVADAICSCGPFGTTSAGGA